MLVASQELQALAQADELLACLEQDQRERVLNYLQAKWRPIGDERQRITDCMDE
jgi:hypothetical protein